MDDKNEKKVWAILIIALFGGNLTGLTGILGNHSNREGHEELQRQLDEIKASDEALGAAVYVIKDQQEQALDVLRYRITNTELRLDQCSKDRTTCKGI